MNLFDFITHNKKAVCYYRHSAEDKQENSVAIQKEQAAKFAAQHSIAIIHEEADEGVSGLVANRPGFQRLLHEWVFNDDAPPFHYILVYDVSRWGRYQNPDQAAMYQYQCEARGKQIIFIEDGMPQERHALITNLQTAVKRFMAAEYSRQLSEKVFFGSAKVSEQGYSAGGIACYGMSRLLLNADKQPVRILKPGEHKQISNERVIFIPTNDSATQTVRDVFDLFVHKGYEVGEIAQLLSKRNIPSAHGGAWSRTKVLRILRNETYAGTRIYNKRWGRLKEKSRQNPPSDWIIRRNAFPAVVSVEDFQKAERKLQLLIPQERFAPHLGSVRQKQLHQNVSEFITSKGVEAEKAIVIAEQMPIIFSESFLRNDIRHWCFLIEDRMRNFDEMLGIGIRASEENITDFFRLPIDGFNEYNYVIFSEREIIYSSSYITSTEVTELLERLFQRSLILQYRHKRISLTRSKR